MQDKNFLQAVQDLQELATNHIEEAIQHMLLLRTTATHATGIIQDESMRAVVTNELITGQIIALLALLRDNGILGEAQYDEFTTYLQRSLISQHFYVIVNHVSA